MPPRSTTDLTQLFEMLVEDLRIHLIASVDKNLTALQRRVSVLEKRLQALDPQRTQAATETLRCCSVCERQAMARGLCSAHYQQWRYRGRKSLAPKRDTAVKVPSSALFSVKKSDSTIAN